MQQEDSEGEAGDSSVFARKKPSIGIVEPLPKFQNSVFDLVQNNNKKKKKVSEEESKSKEPTT